jgi:NADH-quinone oxidoreductase subunit J
MDLGAMISEVMDWASDARNVVFLVIALVMVGAAVLVVTSRNVVHAALMLMLTLAGSAGLFLMLGAEFVAWTLVLVYLGAVIVLFLFGIMITRAPLGWDVRLDYERRWPAALVGLGLFATLAYAVVEAGRSEGLPGFSWDTELANSVVNTTQLGTALFQRFVLPFEVVSLLLLAALIGGIVLARRDPDVPGPDLEPLHEQVETFVDEGPGPVRLPQPEEALVAEAGPQEEAV